MDAQPQSAPASRPAAPGADHSTLLQRNGFPGADAGGAAGAQRRPRPVSCENQGPFQIAWSLDRASDVGRALLAATRRLGDVPIKTAQLDAAVLLAYVLGLNKAWIYAHPTRQMTVSEIERFEALVHRRACHEPVAYLVGYRPFYGIDITVDPRS